MVVVRLDTHHPHEVRPIRLGYVLRMQRCVSPDEFRMTVNIVENLRDQAPHVLRHQSNKSLSSDQQNLIEELEPARVGALRNHNPAHLKIEVKQSSLCQDGWTGIHGVVVITGKGCELLVILQNRN